MTTFGGPGLSIPVDELPAGVAQVYAHLSLPVGAAGDWGTKKIIQLLAEGEALVNAYTRGKCWATPPAEGQPGVLYTDVQQVIVASVARVTAAARIWHGYIGSGDDQREAPIIPTYIPVGDWTLSEMAVLNRYRRRAQ